MEKEQSGKQEQTNQQQVQQKILFG